MKPGRLVRFAMLERCGGDIALAAERLHMPKKRLHQWILDREKVEGRQYFPERKRKVRVDPTERIELLTELGPEAAARHSGVLRKTVLQWYSRRKRREQGKFPSGVGV